MKVNPLQNWPLKVLAILLAFFLWMYFTGEEKILKDIDVPLEINVAPDKILLGEPSSNVTVRVKGTETAISRLGGRFIYSSIDLTDFPPVEKHVPISVDENIYGLPQDLEVVSVTPERIKVTIEQKATKKILIQANIVGQPEKAFVYYGHDINPRSVRIEGGEKDIQEIDKTLTEPIDINGKRESFQINVDILLENSSLKLTNPSPVTVHVKIGKDISRATYENIPITFIHKEQLFTSSHEHVALSIRGPVSILKKLSKSGVRASVNLKDLQPSNEEYVLAPIFSFPNLSEQELSRLSIDSWSPEAISVKIQLRSVT